VGDPELVLLDEPTNHLDIESILWLEAGSWPARRFATVTVTHDRLFLQARRQTASSSSTGRNAGVPARRRR